MAQEPTHASSGPHAKRRAGYPGECRMPKCANATGRLTGRFDSNCWLRQRRRNVSTALLSQVNASLPERSTYRRSNSNSHPPARGFHAKTISASSRVSNGRVVTQHFSVSANDLARVIVPAVEDDRQPPMPVFRLGMFEEGPSQQMVAPQLVVLNK